MKLARGPNGEVVTLEHDACGRVVQRTVARNGFRPQRWRFGWNAQDQLISAACPDGDVWTYAYDPFGRRVSKHCKHTKTTFLWDGDVIAREITEARGGPQTVDWFFEPNSFRPMARLEGGNLSYVINDHLGTPKEVIGADGYLLWSADHDTWGTLRTRKTAGSTQGEEDDFWLTLTDTPDSTTAYPPDPAALYCPIRFQGQWEDAETGLYYNRFRYCDVSTGQFMSADPVGLVGGHRPNAYVSTPTTIIDPKGLTPLDAPGYSLYHIIDDATGNVAYVGISNNPNVRALQHDATGRLGRGYTLSPVSEDLTYAQARGYEQADIERLGTRDTSRRGLPFEAGEANRCNSFDTARCDARAKEFNRYREERLKSMGCCRS